MIFSENNKEETIFYIKNKSFIKTITKFLSVILIFLAIFCTGLRIQDFTAAQTQTALVAAVFSMSNGTYRLVGYNASEDNAEPEKVVTAPAATVLPSTEPTAPPEREGVKKYKIIETQYGAGGSQYNNFFVKNKTNYSLNVSELLKEPLGFKIKDTNDVQVLIVHTHASESYMDYDQGFYYEDFYPRTTDLNKNVTQVGQSIVDSLNKAGIGAVVDKTIHDKTYSGSYYRSYETIEKNLEKYPNIKVVIDIHRDSIGDDSSGKMKPTFVYKGKKAAQIMIMSGYDEDGSYDFPDWNYNLRFALRLQQKAETMYPGMTRPLDFGDYVYNMNINTGSLLIEVGTDANTLDEATYTGELLGNALSEVLKEAK